MNPENKRRTHFIIKNRGLFEDIFLYLILISIIGFSSWFLFSTQQDLKKEKESEQTEKKKAQIFLEALDQEKASQPDLQNSNTSSKVTPEKFDRDYLAYLQAQANLNEQRYELGHQAYITNSTRKNIGFLIGMLLSLIGCIVIVRRIRNMDISAEGSAVGNQLKFATASPGVMMILLGSIIILTTILRTDKVTVTDNSPLAPFQIGITQNNSNSAPSTEGEKETANEINRAKKENEKREKEKSEQEKSNE